LAVYTKPDNNVNRKIHEGSCKKRKVGGLALNPYWGQKKKELETKQQGGGVGY